jgi:hypothetical protein
LRMIWRLWVTEDVTLGEVLNCLEAHAADLQKVPLHGSFSIPARFR